MSDQSIAKLQQAARQALTAGDLASAKALLQQLVDADRNNIGAWLNLAALHRQTGHMDAAFLALREALRLDPRNFPALLMVATLLDREGRTKAAAHAYGIALAQAPPDQYLDPPTLQAVQRAREIHGAHIKDLNAFIRDDVVEAWDRCSEVERRRLDAFIDTTLRTRKRYQQEPLEYYYPGLPSIEFYERSEFPWLSDLEEAAATIQKELRVILREDQKEFAPYVRYDDHLPLDQWRELNHSPQWTAFHFFDKGKPVVGRCERAPETYAMLCKLPQPQVPLRSPAGLFSVLQPKTHIPPHTGVANFRLLVHLPLILPPSCRFRVGGETREWRLGQAWVFDDTIEHEAWNDSDQVRVILIADVWSPRLSPDERSAISRVIAATDAYNGTVPSASA